MITIKEAIIVEGKYDKIRIDSVIDTLVVPTNGFNIFTNTEKQKLIKEIAKKRGIIILTDSDRAGFLIRNFLCGIVDNKYIKHAFIPQIEGVEKRKDIPSKDGFLGVEGINNEIIEKAILSAASVCSEKKDKITKADLYMLGLSGNALSKVKRDKLLVSLGLPTAISANTLVAIINTSFTLEEIKKIIKESNI